MYLHLGMDRVVRNKHIIGIFDLETTTVSKTTRNYLGKMQQAGAVVTVSQELPKSFVLCCDEGRNTVYISQISTATLRKRAAHVEEMANV